MTYAVIDVGSDVPVHMEVQMLPAYAAVIDSVFSLLMEGGSHIEEQAVDLVLGE